MTAKTLHTATDASPSPAKARFWDKLARKYAGDPISDLAGYEATLARTQARLSPTQRVLEIGCGTGSTALRLAPSTGQFVATDVSPQMIAIAREKLAAAPQPNLEFVVADADAPAPGHAAYDVVLAFNLLHLVSDLDAALTAAVDALAPGGLFIAKTPCLSEMNWLVPKVLLPLMRWVGKAPDVLCFAESQLKTAMTNHGLEILAVERHGTKGKDIRPFIVARKPSP